MKICFRFVLPGSHAITSGNWLFGAWNWAMLKGYPEIGLRVFGFEIWAEMWHR